MSPTWLVGLVFGFALQTAGVLAEEGGRRTSDRPAGGTLLWEDYLDPAGGPDFPLHVTAFGRRVFVAGSVTLADREGAFVVRAHDAVSGELLWQDQDDRGVRNDLAYGVAATGDAVFAVGGVRDPDDADWLVRAYDPDTGAVGWEDQFDKAGRNDFATEVAHDEGRLYVGGITTAPTVDPRFPFNFNWHLRAYDAKTGALAWQAETDVAGGNDQSLDMAVGEGRVVMVGFVQTATGDRDLLVRVFDATTGALLWADQVDGGGTAETGLGVTLGGGRVLVAGSVGDDFSVRAYRAASGALLWEDRFDLAVGDDLATAVALQGGRVFATGRARNAAGNYDFVVRAFDARTGRLLWQEQTDPAGGDDAGRTVVARGGRAFVGGAVARDATCRTFASGNCQLTVRAYAGETGALLWEDRRPNAGGSDHAFALAAQRKRLFVAGRVTNSSGGVDYVVRALEAGRPHEH